MVRYVIHKAIKETKEKLLLSLFVDKKAVKMLIISEFCCFYDTKHSQLKKTYYYSIYLLQNVFYAPLETLFFSCVYFHESLLRGFAM